MITTYVRTLCGEDEHEGKKKTSTRPKVHSRDIRAIIV
jgi:hypothetical protein